MATKAGSDVPALAAIGQEAGLSEQSSRMSA